MNKIKPEPLSELLAAVDQLEIAWVTGQDDRKARERLIKARRSINETVATTDQIIAVLERQLEALPIYNETRLCEDILKCSKKWLWTERRAGRWLNFETDARGARFYTREQILDNLRGEKKSNLKLA